MDNLNLGESIKKLLLAGVGAAVTTAEKSKDILDDLVEKGALTVEQGKIINEELKHNIKETVREHTASAQKAAALGETADEKANTVAKEDVLNIIGKMTLEELSVLRQQLKAVEDSKKAEADDKEETKV